jgi:phage shock protein A
MIFGKLWKSFQAQLNKVANFFWTADPIAQMQYEYDRIVDQLKEGRVGLEQYQALVARVARQVENNRKNVALLEAKIKAHLKSGNRDLAAKFALQLEKAKKELVENEAQQKMHNQAYENNLTKVKHASEKLGVLRDKIHKYDADLKMSRAEAELAKVVQSFNLDVTTDLGQIEQVIQDKIDRNRAVARVAADLSGEGLEEVQREQELEASMGEDALQQFEAEHGLSRPEPPAPPALPAPAMDETTLPAPHFAPEPESAPEPEPAPEPQSEPEPEPESEPEPAHGSPPSWNYPQ